MNQLPTASTATPTPTDQRNSDAQSALSCGRQAAVLAQQAATPDSPYSDRSYRVTGPDEHDAFRRQHEAGALSANYDATDRGGSFDDAGAASDEFFFDRLRALVQAHAQFWGSGHGRTLADEYTAQLTAAAGFLATEAVTTSLAGLETNPHDTADRLHCAIDEAQAAHLAKVGDHTPGNAYADSRFSSAVQAMADAVQGSSDLDRTARALRTALDMVVAEQAAKATQ